MRQSRIRLGQLEVNRLGFGAMRVVGNDQVWGEPRDRGHAHKVLRRAFELGMNFFDTAESYGPHTDEILIAEALHPYPKGLVVATKCGLTRPRPGSWDADCRPEKLRSDLEGSLKRLKLERIDLYQLHTVDPKVPLEVSVGTLADMQREGKVRHIGLSNVSVKELEAARRIVPIVSVQNRYGLADRGSEDVLRHCEKHEIAFLPWYPLGAGSAVRASSVKTVAKKIGARPAQVVLAWLLAKSPVLLPIPGTNSLEHLEENAGATGLRLEPEDLLALEA
ncbi:MAG: aldo/keto reductase [Acidobacteriota bacterium]